MNDEVSYLLKFLEMLGKLGWKICRESLCMWRVPLGIFEQWFVKCYKCVIGLTNLSCIRSGQETCGSRMSFLQVPVNCLYSGVDQFWWVWKYVAIKIVTCCNVSSTFNILGRFSKALIKMVSKLILCRDEAQRWRLPLLQCVILKLEYAKHAMISCRSRPVGVQEVSGGKCRNRNNKILP